MRVIFGPWETRTVTVPGMGGHLPVQSLLWQWHVAASYGASTPGTYPWRSPANRVAVADAARAKTLASAGETAGPRHDADMTALGGAYQRWDYQSGLSGMRTQTHADRVLVGTNYDDYLIDMWDSTVTIVWDNYWLYTIFRLTSGPTTPPLDTNASALSYNEWQTLFGDSPFGGVFAAREFDLSGMGAVCHITLDFLDTSTLTGGSPTFDARWINEGTTWRPAATILGLPVLQSLTSTYDLGMLPGQWLFGSTPLGPDQLVVEESDVSSQQISSVPHPTGTVEGYFSPVTEHIVPSSVWAAGMDPGYDETGGIPTPEPGSGVYTGGPGANWYATVRLAMTTTYTIKQRWVRFLPSTPPLHQVQRLGVLDSPEQFSSSLLTPQSSGWQGSML